MVTIPRMPKSSNVAVDGSGLTDSNLRDEPWSRAPVDEEGEGTDVGEVGARPPAAATKSVKNTDKLPCGGTLPGSNTVAVE